MFPYGTTFSCVVFVVLGPIQLDAMVTIVVLPQLELEINPAPTLILPPYAQNVYVLVENVAFLLLYDVKSIYGW
jgi:hypothetical protein